MDLSLEKEFALRKAQHRAEELQEWVKENNRHTLKLSLVNQQSGVEDLWSQIDFYSEDNAFSHIGIVEALLYLITREENKRWGHKHTNEEVVERIINPIKQILEGGNYPDMEEE